MLTSEIAPVEGEDEFGSDDFDEVDFSVPCADHPDEVSLDADVPSARFRKRNGMPDRGNPISVENNRPRSPPSQNNSNASKQGPQTPQSDVLTPIVIIAHGTAAKAQPPQVLSHQHRQCNSAPVTNVKDTPRPAEQTQQLLSNAMPDEDPRCQSSSLSAHEPPLGFFTARAAESLQNGLASTVKAPAFDPYLESPSIRKTAGVDHTKTKPINREIVAAPAVPASLRANVVNPVTDKTRKVGMPAISGPSPLQNRGSYKRPQLKRAPEDTGSRSALTDVPPYMLPGVGIEKRHKTGLEARATNSRDGVVDS